MQLFFRLISLSIGVLGSLLVSVAHADSGKKNHVNWQAWSDAAFAQAKTENKLLLLDLEAVWCHWCHVMEEETYGNPEVAQILNSKFINLKVDQDSRPDLSNRYGEYGWPATIIFDAQGRELRKLRGYIEPKDMLEILHKVLNDRQPQVEKPEPNFARDALLPENVRSQLLKAHYENFDYQLGSLDSFHKWLYADLAELLLHIAQRGDADGAKAKEMARLTFDGALKLIDPVWGGAYQYSTDRDWSHPHFEKIMQIQADDIRLYSEAFLEFKDERYLVAAKSVARYVDQFLKAENGAFYGSQDADLVKGQHSGEYFALGDSERRARGMPAIDKHVYARENGWMIRALCSIYVASGEIAYLETAKATAETMIKTRALETGGYRHDEVDLAGPYLGDSLSMSRAFLTLYSVTGGRRWLSLAVQTAKFTIDNFQDPKAPGFFTAISRPGAVLAPVKLVDENVEVVRLLRLLAGFSGDRTFSVASESAMRYIATPEIATSERTNPGILVASEEFSTEPLHITVVGHKDEVESQKLFSAALAIYSPYKRLEWWDKREGAMPNADVQYPELPKPAAFICGNKRCSLPIFDGAKIPGVIKSFYG